MSNRETSEIIEQFNTAFQQHVWVELASPDIDASVAFYAGLFGWQVSQADQSSDYQMCSSGGKIVSGIRPLPGAVLSPQWVTYLSTDDTARFSWGSSSSASAARPTQSGCLRVSFILSRWPRPGSMILLLSSPIAQQAYSLSDGVLSNADYTSAKWYGAPNGLVSSARDMARWDTALTAGRVLPPSLLQQMWEPTLLANGKSAEFGLAWRVERYESGKVVSHTGSGPRCSCYHARFLDAQVSMILLANRGGANVRDIGKAVTKRFLLSEARS